MSDSQIAILSYCVPMALYALMIFGLTRGTHTNGTTLPSFVALSTLGSLTFCMFCLFAALAIRSKFPHGDSRVIFMIFLLLPFVMGFCLLMSALAFLTVKVVPGMNKIIMSDADKKAKTRIIK